MISIHTANEYKELENMTVDELIKALQICYHANIECTNYRGQKNYIGDGADYLAYACAQGAKQAIQLLEACELLLENLGVDTEEGEY